MFIELTSGGKKFMINTDTIQLVVTLDDGGTALITTVYSSPYRVDESYEVVREGLTVCVNGSGSCGYDSCPIDFGDNEEGKDNDLHEE